MSDWKRLYAEVSELAPPERLGYRISELAAAAPAPTRASRAWVAARRNRGRAAELVAAMIAIAVLAFAIHGHGGSARPSTAASPLGKPLHEHRLVAPTVPGDYYGESVATSGRTAVVGAPKADHQRGVVYVFARTAAGQWRRQQDITPADAAPGDNYGISVAISGSTMIVGASFKDAQRGAAYVYSRSGGRWVQQQELRASNAVPDRLFGSAVAVGNRYAVVCAQGDDISLPGYCYAYNPTRAGWVETQTMTDSKPGLQFGRSVAIGGSRLIIGAPGEHHWNGAAYLFIRGGAPHLPSNGKRWYREQYLTTPQSGSDNQFGSSVAVTNTEAVVGALYETVSGQNAAGAAYVFAQTSATDLDGWKLQRRLTEPHPVPRHQFGIAVALSGSIAVIGAPGPNDWTGATYVFEQSGRHWTLRHRLTASDAAPRDYFGGAVAATPTTIVVTAYGPSKPSYGGEAYAYSP